jgi:hypothetical protein
LCDALSGLTPRISSATTAARFVLLLLLVPRYYLPPPPFPMPHYENDATYRNPAQHGPDIERTS